MNYWPLIDFYLKHRTDLDALASSGSGESSLVLDFLTANVPVIKKHWPQANKNGMLDDFATALKATLTPPPPPAPNQM